MTPTRPGGLSLVELRAARLDGDVFELGRGYLPADAVDTPPLRGATLVGLYGSGLAAVGMSAAWVHGATDIEPGPHLAQAVGRSRTHRYRPGLRLREAAIDPADVIVVGGLSVAALPVALADLALAAASTDAARPGRRVTARGPTEQLEAAFAELSADTAAVSAAADWLRARRTPHKGGALRLLRAAARPEAAAQPDVTRYTS